MNHTDGRRKTQTDSSDPLDLFHPIIRAWFQETYPAPTGVQRKAWPAIARGEHVLVTAPTGSGKTLTAFLWAIDSLVCGRWQPGTVRVLYLSPLKALNTDVRRNLLEPLSQLEERFRRAGQQFPDIRVLTRSGDTPQSERQKMSRKPPEILITTPESLNLILSSTRTRYILSGVKAVIMDEIHAIASGKRGTYLITAVDRITLLAGEFQRIGISATVKPLNAVAEFIGGSLLEEYEGTFMYRKRPVSIIRSAEEKRLDVSVRLPEEGFLSLEEHSPWPAMVRDFKEIIHRNRSSLLFTNTRRHAEKITLLINENEQEEIAYSHHGSLSREIRKVVEERLKQGELKAIVATNSLELGIDIGELDEVVLIQTPPSVSSALQRIGRAGHSVGKVSRGSIYPIHGRDLIDAGVMAQSVLQGDIEEVLPVKMPLDVLAQIIASMTGVEEWNIERLYAFLRSTSPYRELSRKLFDLVLEMLAGRYADSRIRELRPRVSIDRLDGSVRGVEGVLPLLYHSGGTIPDRGYYGLRLQGSGSKIGELDEEFVWERKVGDTFPLGAQRWKIVGIDHQNVEVVPWHSAAGIVPFWRAENRYREFHYAEKTALFLETWNDRIQTDEFYRELIGPCRMNDAAARETVTFLLEQKEITGAALPHRHHILIEHHREMLEKAREEQVIIHTLWGGRINFPFSLILSSAWEALYGFAPELYADNDAIILVVPDNTPHDAVTTALYHASQGDLESALRKKLEGTGYFGARFRENAGRALLLPKGSINRRMPLWITRLRARKLLDSVMNYEDFPVLLETWRTCLQDEFDLPTLRLLLDELARKEITVSECRTGWPSPFARNLIWTQTNTQLYRDDTPAAPGMSALSGDVLKEAVFASHLRPQLRPETVRRFQEKLQRLAPGYAPSSAREVLDWLKERVLIPQNEWEVLIRHVLQEAEKSGESPDRLQFFRELQARAVLIQPPGAEFPSVCAAEFLPRIFGALAITPEARTDTSVLRALPCSEPFSGEGDAAAVPETQTDGQLDLDTELRTLIDRAFRVRISAAEDEDPAETLLSEWLRFYGPLPESYPSRVFGFDPERLGTMYSALEQEQAVVRDILTGQKEQIEVCDPENLEYLLRISRAESRPAFTALPLECLPLFLADYHGLTRRGDCEEGLKDTLERLFGYPASPELWEREIFPARLAPYYPAWLDELLRSSDLAWFGCGKKTISFSLLGDFELFTENFRESDSSRGAEGRQDHGLRFPDLRGKYDFWQLQSSSGLTPSELTQELWQAAWKGSVSNDSFEIIRKGIASGFKAPEPGSDDGAESDPALLTFRERRRRMRCRNLGNWGASRALSGNWFLLPRPEAPADALDREELIKDRVRQLLSRYGVLFRQILENELSFLRWSAIFRTLRLMELSGEILSGSFFEGIPGLQFISHQAFRHLSTRITGETSPAENAVYFLNAQDPASLCGFRFETDLDLPPRVSSTHLVYKGKQLVLISRRQGRDLEFRVPPEDPDIPEYLEFFKTLMGRKADPVTSVKVESINGKPARNSPYGDSLAAFGFSREYKAFHLRGSAFSFFP